MLPSLVNTLKQHGIKDRKTIPESLERVKGRVTGRDHVLGERSH